MPAPLSRRSRTILKSRSTSPGGSTAVGSSSTSTPPPAVPALQGGGDGDDRALDRRGLGQRLGDVEVDGERRHQPPGRSGLLSPPHAAEAGAGEAAVQGQVVDGVQLEDQARGPGGRSSGGRRGRACRGRAASISTGSPSSHASRARVGVVVARQDLDERRLARAVVADEGVHLAGADVEVDVVERLGAGERLRQVPDLEDQPVGVRLLRLGAGRARLVAGPLRPHPAEDATSDAAASSRALVLGPRTWNSHRPTSGIGDSPRAEATPCRRALHSVAQIRGSATPCRDSCRDSSRGFRCSASCQAATDYATLCCASSPAGAAGRATSVRPSDRAGHPGRSLRGDGDGLRGMQRAARGCEDG